MHRLFFTEQVASWGLSTCQVFCTNDHDSSIYHLTSKVEDGTHCVTQGEGFDGVCIENECMQVGGPGSSILVLSITFSECHRLLYYQ